MRFSTASHTFTHIHTHTYIHTYMYKYIHMYTYILYIPGFLSGSFIRGAK